ncbi:CLUMA_CG017199, isoform A [Clunio marinus]|uniref:CLUMA_CG017199, isoform A n=1 Tax=Clunio marinus TaxID=568069 RepID=A0A1J1IY69_9DIPT|nr:CLUMA_CG017199, isoform A [Clunio marinus]
MRSKIPMKLILIGLLSQIDFSQSRAVNISNTWTLPQPGFNVFYRYFRDKISWFEADAVCQFHHANLVTVQNIEQFDAARTFLKDLDISDYVWIGLMRPTNADQFSWTNSKPLPISEGYWAEPWPVAETPLCAVIDPARDNRWHALRCGGPETAAFLCEMEIPDWALHCTANSEITVQYISDSGAVQLSRQCQNFTKEISCQSKMTQMAMYNELKCPEEQTTFTSTERTTVDESTTRIEETHPVVIIKNPQKMLEDVLSDIETNIEIDSNRLDIADVRRELVLMVGDQPIVENPEEDKKVLLKIPEKKEVYQKKSKSVKKETKNKDDGEMMMGDAPAEEAHDETLSTVITSSTTERQRRDTETTISVDLKVTTELASSTELNEGLTAEVTETISTDLSTEAPQVTTVVTEETTTKFIVQGVPLFHSQVVFKDPIPQIDAGNGTLDRKNVSKTEDHFIPPMLLVKARFTVTKSTEGSTEEASTELPTTSIPESSIVDNQSITQTTEEEKNLTTPKPTDSNDISTNEISSQSQLETTPALTSIANEKPINIEKRHDPRMGLLNSAQVTTHVPSTTVPIAFSSTEMLSSTTEEPTTMNTEEFSSTVFYDSSSVSEIIATEMNEMSSESSSTISSPESTAERLVESTTTQKVAEESTPIVLVSVTPIALKASEVSTSIEMNKLTTQMGNDIDGGHEMSHENFDENGSYEHHHPENNLNNEDFEPYKPNRHRSIIKSEHHHGPGFSIGKILG